MGQTLCYILMARALIAVLFFFFIIFFLLFPCQTCKDKSIQPHTSAGACSCRANAIEMNGNVNSDFNSEVCQGSNQH